MKTVFKFLIALLAVTGAVMVMSDVFGVQFARFDYWDFHGALFLVFVTFFPRLTVLLAGISTGGVAWWLGWLFAPRVLVAVLATLNYWYQNPFLVVIAWLVAVGGESSEKYMVVRGSRDRWQGARRGYDSAKWVDSEKR